MTYLYLYFDIALCLVSVVSVRNVICKSKEVMTKIYICLRPHILSIWIIVFNFGHLLVPMAVGALFMKLRKCRESLPILMMI